MTKRDLYRDARLLAKRLAAGGHAAAAGRINDTIDGGCTSSEILFGLRAELDRLLEELPSRAQERPAVRELRDAVHATVA